MQKLVPFKTNGGLEAYRNELHGMVAYICPQCHRSRDVKITILFRFTGGSRELYAGCPDCFIPNWEKWERHLDKLKERDRAARRKAVAPEPEAVVQQPSLFGADDTSLVAPKKRRPKDDISHLRNW